MNVTSNTSVKATDGIMNLTDEKMYEPMSGKWMRTTPIFDCGSLRNNTCE